MPRVKSLNPKSPQYKLVRMGASGPILLGDVKEGLVEGDLYEVEVRPGFWTDCIWADGLFREVTFSGRVYESVYDWESIK
jgi:hypothetical protein